MTVSYLYTIIGGYSALVQKVVAKKPLAFSLRTRGQREGWGVVDSRKI